MVCEVIIKVKNDDKSLTTNHLIYEEITASESDPIIKQLIRDTSDHFLKDAEEITDIKVTIKIECT